MEAAVKEQVKKIVGEAIKLYYDVEYLWTIEDLRIYMERNFL